VDKAEGRNPPYQWRYMVLPQPMKMGHQYKTTNAIIVLAVFGVAVSLTLLLLVKLWWITVFGFILSTLRNSGLRDAVGLAIICDIGRNTPADRRKATSTPKRQEKRLNSGFLAPKR
jgi:hypothetical protein